MKPSDEMLAAIAQYLHAPEIEIEVRFESGIDAAALDWVESAQLTTVTRQQTINTISAADTIVKQITFEGTTKKAVRIYQKVTKYSVKTPEYKFSIASESCAPHQEQIDLVRIKNRYRIETPAFPDWFLDITLVDQQEGLNLGLINKSKATMFPFGPLDKDGMLLEIHQLRHAMPSLKLEIEFELKPSFGNLSAEEICGDIQRMVAMRKKKDHMQWLGNLVGKKGKTLKEILPPVIELNKQIWSDKVLPRIGSFFISDKADGIRVIVHAERETRWFTSDDSGVLGPVEGSCNWTESSFVAEAELIEVDGKQFAYLYDLLQLDDEPLRRLPFGERLHKLQHELVLPSHGFCKVKPIVSLVGKNGIDISDDILVSALNKTPPFDHKEYISDGVIFTLDALEDQVYKWKPMECMSVDFLARHVAYTMLPLHYRQAIRYPEGGDQKGGELYILHCSISSAEFKKMHMKKLHHHQHKNSFGKYLPVPFAPADNKMAFVFWSTESLDDKIIEVTWDMENHRWKLLRVREDRTDDYRRGKYFGNHFFVAEMIWRNFANPLTPEHMLDPRLLSKELYFQSSEEGWKAVREYNNRVKEALLQRYKRGTAVVDLGAGKGQDILKYCHAGLHQMVLIDSNENNLCEIIRRRRQLIQSRKDWEIALGVLCQDLNSPHEDTLEKLFRGGLLPREVSLVCCHFALHYLVKDRSSTVNIAKLCRKLLQRDGYFLFSGLDGAKVHQRFEKKDEFSIGDRYRFRKLYKGTAFRMGQRISVTVPFSPEPYEEYLIDIPKVVELFEHNGFRLVQIHEFAAHLPVAELSPEDKEYVGLLAACAFIRK